VFDKKEMTITAGIADGCQVVLDGQQLLMAVKNLNSIQTGPNIYRTFALLAKEVTRQGRNRLIAKTIRLDFR
jgi:hypothetical protein